MFAEICLEAHEGHPPLDLKRLQILECIVMSGTEVKGGAREVDNHVVCLDSDGPPSARTLSL